MYVTEGNSVGLIVLAFDLRGGDEETEAGGTGEFVSAALNYVRAATATVFYMFRSSFGCRTLSFTG